MPNRMGSVAQAGADEQDGTAGGTGKQLAADLRCAWRAVGEQITQNDGLFHRNHRRQDRQCYRFGSDCKENRV
jgi:hypothetical protein